MAGPSITRGIVAQARAILVGHVAVMSFAVVDTVLTGHASAVDLATLGLGLSVYSTVFVGLMGAVGALNPIIAQHFGAGRLAAIGASYGQGLWMALLLSAAGFLVLAFPEVWLPWLHPPPEVEPLVARYLRVLSLALPASLLFRAIYSLNTAVSRPHVVMALQHENVDAPAGSADRGATEALVRVTARGHTADDIAAIPVKRKSGVAIYVRDLAQVTDGVEEPRNAAFLDEQPALALDVQKQSGANTVAVADGVRAAVDRIGKDLPPGVSLQIVRDDSAFIRDSIHDVNTTMIIGGILTVLIVFLFLNSWRSTVITGLTLPISVIAAFIAMKAFGFTLNVLTLMGLSLAIGMLIDDAIVVRENIVRHLQRGKGHFDAARDGTAEIGLAVMATTFTIVAVFVPVAFMGGMVGQFFYEFGITVAAAVLV